MLEFGKCVILEGVRDDVDRPFDDVGALIWACGHFVLRAGMTPLEPPRPVMANQPPPMDGWTVTQTMEESIAALHAFPSKSYIRFMLDSCRDFDHRRLMKEFKDFFRLSNVRIYTLLTGMTHRNCDG